nr:nudix [Calliteara abietis nucleopolyhedrovirus]
MRSAGLFLITSCDKAVLLRAQRSYDSARPIDKRRNKIFLEKISIPRGKRDGDDTFGYETAVREFIEETATFFESAVVYEIPFVLQWNDNGVDYKYAIYVGMLRGTLKPVSREPNSFCVKLHTNRPNEYNVNIESRRFNNEIRRRLHLVALTDYFRYMSDQQLTTYVSSNYLDFFEFVKHVKTEFDARRLLKFFVITLKLNNWELLTTTSAAASSSKWNLRRANIILATRRELLNVVNV